jgi:hypothetical protein
MAKAAENPSRRTTVKEKMVLEGKEIYTVPGRITKYKTTK